MVISAVRSAAIGLAAFGCLLGTAARADQIGFNDTRHFPESVTSDRAGDIFFGSMAKGVIYRARAGQTTATAWITPQITGLMGVLGVFADDKSNTLYACSIALGAPPEKAAALSSLRAFNLKTGDAKGNWPLPGAGKALCNDIAVAKDGTVYVTDTLGGAILRLKKGGALEEWIKSPDLASADGIAVGGDGAVYVNTVMTNRLFKVPVAAGGAAGKLTELKPSLKLDNPDGLRSIGGMKFLQAEGNSGRITEITVKGDVATMVPLHENDVGLTAVTVARGKGWALNTKFQYRNDPKLKDQDPGPFFAQSFDLKKR